MKGIFNLPCGYHRFYGGLCRGVNLISVPDTHFDLEYYGGSGIMVTPKPTECGGAVKEMDPTRLIEMRKDFYFEV